MSGRGTFRCVAKRNCQYQESPIGSVIHNRDTPTALNVLIIPIICQKFQISQLCGIMISCWYGGDEIVCVCVNI